MPIAFTEQDFEHGYWYHLAASMSDPDMYGGEEKLSIEGAPNVSSSVQRKLTKRWISALPSLRNVRSLWVAGKVSQEMFDAICHMDGLEALWLKFSGIRSIQAITQLSKLESFHLGSSTQLQSIEPLTKLEKLRWLELENIKLIRDISPIGECKQLVGLAVEGSMWTTQRLDSLGPIGKLLNLRYLSIINLRTTDKSLKHLYPLTKLVRLRKARWWDEAEMQEIRHRNPELVH